MEVVQRIWRAAVQACGKRRPRLCRSGCPIMNGLTGGCRKGGASWPIKPARVQTPRRGLGGTQPRRWLRQQPGGPFHSEPGLHGSSQHLDQRAGGAEQRRPGVLEQTSQVEAQWPLPCSD